MFNSACLCLVLLDISIAKRGRCRNSGIYVMYWTRDNKVSSGVSHLALVLCLRPPPFLCLYPR